MSNGNNTPVKDFHTKHSLNDKSGFVFDGNWIIYIDGASRENASFGAMQEPSKDKRERLKVIERFYELKLKLAVQEFTLYKQGLKAKTKLSIMNRYPQPATDEEIARLQHLRDKRDGLRAIQQKMEKEKERIKSQQMIDSEEGLSIQEECAASLRKIEGIG